MPIEPATYVFDDLKEGMSASFNVTVTDDVIRAFAELSGDQSPLHVNDAFAATTPFGGRIAHGMIVGAFFSQMIGMHLPGKHAAYLSQSIKFHHPVRPGAALTIRGTVAQTVAAARAIRVMLEAVNVADGATVADGEAMVRLLA